MSRLTDLIQQVKAKDPPLGADLEAEFRVLSGRRPFGLNFERHRPEAVELPSRPVRRGDKVRILPPRGSTARGDRRLWRVDAVIDSPDGTEAIARLTLFDADEPEGAVSSVADLVVVAEFRDAIYPGLISTGKVQRGTENQPFHTVINGENFHVLEALTYTHRGRIDAIYIDPPYNTGARDWKYNNDYVEGDDMYRHSKWLAFMERRLQLAKQLLNPDKAVLIVTVDEREYLRLGLLLEQVFPEASISMVSSVINPAGAGRNADFSRTDEYVFCLRFGSAAVLPESRQLDETPVVWDSLRRSSLANRRGNHGKGACGPNQFYPIYVDPSTGQITAIGEPMAESVPVASVKQRAGLVAVLPIRPTGVEMNWGVVPPVARSLLDSGYLRAGKAKPTEPQPYVISYLTGGIIRDIESGVALTRGRRPDGTIDAVYPAGRDKMPTSNWNRPSHDAQQYGTKILISLLGNRSFPYPKSLFAVEDVLRFFLLETPGAVVLDFFAGSGTTAHAVMRLNKQDGGRRQCISVTNNEAAAGEQDRLRLQGFRPGDDEWERWGICDYITKPRIEAAITGRTPDGEPIKGDYKFTDEFPMSDGFFQNAEFFTLTYENPLAVEHNRAFERVAPLLWLRAGAQGRRIDHIPDDGWDVADRYGILFDCDKSAEFTDAMDEEGAVLAYVVTDDDRRFQSVAARLPDDIEPVRLYESYLTNFKLTGGEQA